MYGQSCRHVEHTPLTAHTHTPHSTYTHPSQPVHTPLTAHTHTPHSTYTHPSQHIHTPLTAHTHTPLTACCTHTPHSTNTHTLTACTHPSQHIHTPLTAHTHTPLTACTHTPHSTYTHPSQHIHTPLTAHTHTPHSTHTHPSQPVHTPQSSYIPSKHAHISLAGTHILTTCTHPSKCRCMDPLTSVIVHQQVHGMHTCGCHRNGYSTSTFHSGVRGGWELHHVTINRLVSSSLVTTISSEDYCTHPHVHNYRCSINSITSYYYY